MKKVNFAKLFALLAISMTLIFTTSCEKDDDNNGITASIVGVWTSDTYTAVITVDGVSIIDYIIKELGLTQAQAEAMLEGDDGLGDGTIEFKKDGTFIDNLESEEEGTGTWTLVGEKLTIISKDKDGEMETMIFDVNTLNASTLIVESNETSNEDMNFDGEKEAIVSNIRITLTR
ncbi:MAG: hypothetical protein IMY72_08440 [Bacteroidetes bacterium]|nr:hypothetical protein [Bacteroidota bacterium]